MQTIKTSLYVNGTALTHVDMASGVMTGKLNWAIAPKTARVPSVTRGALRMEL